MLRASPPPCARRNSTSVAIPETRSGRRIPILAGLTSKARAILFRVFSKLLISRLLSQTALLKVCAHYGSDRCQTVAVQAKL